MYFLYQIIYLLFIKYYLSIYIFTDLFIYSIYDHLFSFFYFNRLLI